MADTETLFKRFRSRFPVKLDGTGGGYSWERGDRPPVSEFEPAKGFRGGRRGDGNSICMVAYHAALGDAVSLHTVVKGKRRTYVLAIRPEEGRAYLEHYANLGGFNLMREPARQWLRQLDKAEQEIWGDDLPPSRSSGTVKP